MEGTSWRGREEDAVGEGATQGRDSRDSTDVSHSGQRCRHVLICLWGRRILTWVISIQVVFHAGSKRKITMWVQIIYFSCWSERTHSFSSWMGDSCNLRCHSSPLGGGEPTTPCWKTKQRTQPSFSETCVSAQLSVQADVLRLKTC